MSCDSDGPPDCVAVWSGLRVDVRDAVSGEVVDSAVVEVLIGSETVALELRWSGAYEGPAMQAGEFPVTVTAPGYVDATAVVRVTQPCRTVFTGYAWIELDPVALPLAGIAIDLATGDVVPVSVSVPLRDR